MALKPSKDDPNHDAQLKEYQKDNSRWGGDDLKQQKPTAPPSPEKVKKQ